MMTETKVLLDTNFIIACTKQKIYYDERIKELLLDSEILMPSQVINELKRLSEDKKQKTADREAAHVGMMIARKYPVIMLRGKYADKGIIEYCTNNKRTAVATIDKRLKTLLKNKAKIITIYGRKNLLLE